jgi:hypothetical protein
MKILQRESIHPIQLSPGDVIQLSYKPLFRPRRVLLRHTVARPYTFNEVAIFELDAEELAEQGLTDAIGGMFMERT